MTARLDLAELDQLGISPERAERWLWRLTALGVGLRLLIYLLRTPIWTDEAKLAVSLLDRGYAGFLEPLAYSQIAPVLFMWLQKSVTLVLGFSEYSLRLLPCAAAVGGVFLMRRLARRVFAGAPAIFALAWFAVSYYPVRHAAELKPYATDLLASLALTVLAVEWFEERRAKWLWWLAVAAPVAIALSYPAVFSAAGVLAALAVSVWREGGRDDRAAWIVASFSGAAVFALNYLLIGAAHQEARAATRAVWPGGFPPLGDPLGALGWLVTAHTGRTFGYPLGGENGGSVLTFVLFAAGALALARAGRKPLLAVLLLPFAAGIAAAVLQRYPYGGSGRVSQYLVPAICLLAGLGAARLTAMAANVARQRRWQRGILTGLIVFAGLLATAAIVHPYRDRPDLEARQFAWRVWVEEARDAVVADAWEDLGLEFARPSSYWTPGGASYRINQRIYFERRRSGGALDLDGVSPEEPLRVVFLATAIEGDPEAFAAWRHEMERSYELVADEPRRLGGFAEQHGEGESVRVLTFVPR